MLLPSVGTFTFTLVHRRVRLEWCRAQSKRNCVDWGRIVFSDAPRFQLCPDDNRRLVLRRSGQWEGGHFPDHRKTRRSQKSVMVWDGISFGSRTRLVVISGIVTTQFYDDGILQPVLLPFVFGHSGHIFQHIMSSCMRYVLLWIVFKLSLYFLGCLVTWFLSLIEHILDAHFRAH